MSLLHILRSEIDSIQDDKIKDFVVEVLSKVPEFYDNQHQLIAETQKAMEFAKVFLDSLQCSDYINDVVKSSVLLQDITKYVALLDEEGDWYIKEDIMHPLNVRSTVLPLLSIIGKDTFDDIMRTVEASHGLNGPIPHVIPSMQDPVFIWILPFANQLARAYVSKSE